MQVLTQLKGKNLVAYLYGELDHHYASEIREKIDSQIHSSNPDKLILDFSNVTFMDSSGIGVVMGRYKLMRSKGGHVVLAAVNSKIEKLIEVSGLRKIIPEFKTLGEALSHSGGITDENS